MASSDVNEPFTSRCSLRKCIQGNLLSGMARVEVRSFLVPANEVQHMEISWAATGDAVFHDICWKAVLDSLKMDNPFCFSAMEKNVLLEAKTTAEYFDSSDKLDREAVIIARLLKSAKYAIAFTGISTSCGVEDFRGKGGKWTERDRERKFGASKYSSRSDKPRVSYESFRPSYTHEALQKLLSVGFLHHIISQNVDSLHRLSGVPREQLSELHGNIFHERCEKCATRYERPYAVRRASGSTSSPPGRVCIHCHFDHRTGRHCDQKGCDGFLVNTVINFGDSLEKRVLSTAEEQAKRNDLVLCLGSSLRVMPACELVEMGKPPIRLVICNRQPTPFDHRCYELDSAGLPLGSRVFGDCDELMRRIMRHLLDYDELFRWEQGRDARLAAYAKQRRENVHDT